MPSVDPRAGGVPVRNSLIFNLFSVLIFLFYRTVFTFESEYDLRKYLGTRYTPSQDSFGLGMPSAPQLGSVNGELQLYVE